MESHFLAALIVCLVLSIQLKTGEAESEDLFTETLINGVNEFALDLYKSLAREPGNIIFSPISISFALAMISLGAKDNTLTEILTTLKINGLDDPHYAFQKLKYSLMSPDAKDKFTLLLNLDYFGENTYNFDEHFKGKTVTHYNAVLKPLDFIGNPEQSRASINEWVKTLTNGKITDLLGPDIIDTQTKLVLVSAIYFKGEWLSKFSSDKTINSQFHVTETKSVDVEMMQNKFQVSHGYSTDLNSQVLELPYKGELSMVIILPNLEETSLDVVEEALTPTILSTFQLDTNECEVSLPKFKLKTSFDLKAKLQRLGIRDLFIEGTADLTSMSHSKNMHVSSLVQQAFIEVDEEGTEAAAATAVVVTNRMAIPEFKADHPFIFCIKDNIKNTIIFLGRVTSP